MAGSSGISPVYKKGLNATQNKLDKTTKFHA